MNNIKTVLVIGDKLQVYSQPGIRVVIAPIDYDEQAPYHVRPCEGLAEITPDRFIKYMYDNGWNQSHCPICDSENFRDPYYIIGDNPRLVLTDFHCEDCGTKFSYLSNNEESIIWVGDVTLGDMEP